VIFWDTSAIVPLIIREEQTHSVKNILRDDKEMLVWWGTHTECFSAIQRRKLEQSISDASANHAKQLLKQISTHWTEVMPSQEVRNHAMRLLLRNPLRAADSLQLGAAMTWARARPLQHAFLSYDIKLNKAAEHEGFSVLGDL